MIVHKTPRVYLYERFAFSAAFSYPVSDIGNSVNMVDGSCIVHFIEIPDKTCPVMVIHNDSSFVCPTVQYMVQFHTFISIPLTPDIGCRVLTKYQKHHYHHIVVFS